MFATVQKTLRAYLKNFVDYNDKQEVNRKITLFEKPLEFEYQEKFRFYVEDYGMKTVKIQIGSLKSILKFLKQRICQK